MRGIWIRRLLPASVVAVVLAFSYFAPALGFIAPGVKNSFHTNCGRFGYGYHGGKHDFVCPTHEPQPAVAAPAAAAPKSGNAGSGSSRLTPLSGASGATNATRTDGVLLVPNASIQEWRGFNDLLLRELTHSVR